jgi:hypothetical protein
MLMSMRIQARVRGDMCIRVREATQGSHKVPTSVDMALIPLANDISTASDTPAYLLETREEQWQAEVIRGLISTPIVSAERATRSS